MPELASPAATAAEMNSPETRGSRASTARRTLARRAQLVGVTTAGEHARGSLGETESQVGGDDLAVGQPADAVRSEESRHGARERARISASRTATPCGPS